MTAADLAREILSLSEWDKAEPEDPALCLQRIQALCLKTIQSTDQPADAPAADDSMERNNTDESVSGIPPMGDSSR